MKLEPPMSIAVDLEPPLTAGATPLGEVRLLSFKAGTFSSSRASYSAAGSTVLRLRLRRLRGMVADCIA